MSTASWKAIITALARKEGKTLKEWSDDCDRQARELYAAIPDYLRKPNLLPERKDAA